VDATAETIAARLDLLRQHGYHLPTADKRLIEGGQLAMLEYHEREMARKLRSKAKVPERCVNCGDTTWYTNDRSDSGRKRLQWCRSCFSTIREGLPNPWKPKPEKKPATRQISSFELEMYGL
jgi:hypothetical protein